MAITVDSWIPVVPTLIVGIGVVVLSAAGFAVALFGRGPLPQIATPAPGPGPTAVNEASKHGGRTRRLRRSRPATTSSLDEGVMDPEPAPPRLRVEVPAQVRIRSAFLLALGVLVAAGVIGLFLSIIAVGFFTLLG